MQKQQVSDPLGQHEFGPNVTGNKAAAEAVEKTKALLDNIVVDEDALLLAERNDVLDHAIERLGENGEHWIIGHLAVNDKTNWKIGINTSSKITEETAALMRQKGTGFCAVGAIGAEFGPHSWEAVTAAVRAVSDLLDERGITNHSIPGNEIPYYGIANSQPVFHFNDRSTGHGQEVVEAFRAAKSQPLRRS